MKSKALALTTSSLVLGLSSYAFAAAGPPTGVPLGPPAGIPAGPPAGVTFGPPAGIPAGPPAGIPAGPPAGVPAGPPSGVVMGPPSGVPSGPPENAANIIGNLNAANASQTGLENASLNSILGDILAYQIAVNDALTLADLGAQSAAITSAREQLALASNKQLTPDAVIEVDSLLGISGVDPTLGTTP